MVVGVSSLAGAPVVTMEMASKCVGRGGFVIAMPRLHPMVEPPALAQRRSLKTAQPRTSSRHLKVHTVCWKGDGPHGPRTLSAAVSVSQQGPGPVQILLLSTTRSARERPEKTSECCLAVLLYYLHFILAYSALAYPKVYFPCSTLTLKLYYLNYLCPR